jgi:cytochrome c
MSHACLDNSFTLPAACGLVVRICSLEVVLMMKNSIFLAFALAIMPSLAFADDDAVEGKIVFKKCTACHAADKEQNKVGPYLVGILGRKAGSVEGFKYSDAIIAKGAEGLV